MVDPHLLTKDPKELEDVFADRFMAPLITVKMVKTFIDIRQVIMTHTAKAPLTQPTYLFCGKDDLLTPSNISVDVFSQVNFQDKKVKVYPKGWLTRSSSAAF